MSNTKELSQVVDKLDKIADEFSALEAFEQRVGELKVVINAYAEAHQRAFNQTEKVSQDVSNFCISTSEVQKALATSQGEIHRTLREYGDVISNLNSPVLNKFDQFLTSGNQLRLTVNELREELKKNTILVNENLRSVKGNAAQIEEVSSNIKNNAEHSMIIEAKVDQNQMLIKHLLVLCYITGFFIIVSLFTHG